MYVCLKCTSSINQSINRKCDRKWTIKRTGLYFSFGPPLWLLCSIQWFCNENQVHKNCIRLVCNFYEYSRLIMWITHIILYYCQNYCHFSLPEFVLCIILVTLVPMLMLQESRSNLVVLYIFFFCVGLKIYT